MNACGRLSVLHAAYSLYILASQSILANRTTTEAHLETARRANLGAG